MLLSEFLNNLASIFEGNGIWYDATVTFVGSADQLKEKIIDKFPYKRINVKISAQEENTYDVSVKSVDYDPIEILRLAKDYNYFCTYCDYNILSKFSRDLVDRFKGSIIEQLRLAITEKAEDDL